VQTKQALAHETTDANSPLSVQNTTHDPHIDSLHIQPIMVAIGMTITFCILWFVIVFILYHLTRSALLVT
jgi:hypothetical protein